MKRRGFIAGVGSARMANRSKHAADGKNIDRGVLVSDLPTDT
jgi:hypothetical protein